jgi:hypothetical protein
VVEFVDPPGEALRAGTSFLWSHTICARMVDGDGPRIAHSVADVPAYADSPLCRQLGVGAYAGAPLRDRDGALWGTLCGMHPTAVPAASQVDESLFRWIARSLATHLVSPLTPAQSGERDRGSGPSTILGAHVWSTVLEKEHERALRTGQVACVIELEVGDDLAARIDDAAQLVAASARGCDFVAHADPARLLVLAVDCPPDGARALMDRLVVELEGAGIGARAAVVDLLPRSETVAAKAVEPPATITYMLCGQCKRRGAYVSPRFPVLRCKYCGLRHALSDLEWREALETS